MATTDENGPAPVDVRPVGTMVSIWGEGPVWWQGRLLHVDIEGHKVVRFDPAAGTEEVWDLGERVGTVVPRASGGLVIAGDSGIALFDPATGARTVIADPEPEKRPDNRFNDGKCDPSGRFWAGTISTVRKTGDANLYMLDAGQRLHRQLTGITNSNGICWSGDRATMFYIDTPTKKIRAFPFDDASGRLGAERTVVDTAARGLEGSPDGMAIDAEDRLWVAMCHAGMVVCFDSSTGEEIRRIGFPCVETTACAFGGDDLDVLYVTTGLKKDLDEPLAGRLFEVRGLGVRGQPAFAYAG